MRTKRPRPVQQQCLNQIREIDADKLPLVLTLLRLAEISPPSILRRGIEFFHNCLIVHEANQDDR